MVWPWNSNPTPNRTFVADVVNRKAQQDRAAYESLDPSLREYLEQNTDYKPPAGVTSLSSSTQPNPLQKPTLYSKSVPVDETGTQTQDVEWKPHSQSAYGDKYADIWATFTPVTEGITSHTPVEKMKEFVDDFKAQKTRLKHAAIENCALENISLRDCWKNGNLATIQGCSAQQHELTRCMEGQIKFLKALGYYSQAGRSDEVDEAIQMHADKLYQKQKEMDAEAKERAMDRIAQGLPREKSAAEIAEDQKPAKGWMETNWFGFLRR